MSKPSWTFTSCLLLACHFIYIESSFGQVPVKSKAEKVDSLYYAVMNRGARDKIPEIETVILNQLQDSSELNRKDVAILLKLEGSIKRETSRPDLALPLLYRALKLMEKVPGETAQVIEIKKFLSYSHGDLGHTDVELRYNNEILDIYRKDEKNKSIELADHYNTVGQGLGMKGDRSAERDYLFKGKLLMDKFKPQNPEQLQYKSYNDANISNSIAISFFESNNFADALMYARKSLSLRETYMPGSTERAINLMTIGRSIGQIEQRPDSALNYLNHALAILENSKMQGSTPWIMYKSYKAEQLILAGNIDSAIIQTQSLISYVHNKKLLNPGSAKSLLQVYITASRALNKKGDYQRSLKLCQQALQNIGKKYLGNDLSGIIFYTQYAATLSYLKDWLKSDAAFNEVMLRGGISAARLDQPEYFIPVTLPYQYLVVYQQLANHSLRKGFATHDKREVVRGIHLLGKIGDAWQARKAWYFEAGIDEGFGTQDESVYDDLLTALYDAKGLIPETERMQLAFRAIESPKAGLLKNKLNEDKQMLALLPEKENRQRLENKLRLYQAFNAVKQGLPGSQDSLLKRKEEYMRYVHNLKTTYLKTAVTDIAVIANADPLLLKHKGTIINYFLGSGALFAFVIEDGKSSFAKTSLLPDFEQDLMVLKGKYLTEKNLSYNDAPEQTTRISKRLYRWLLADTKSNGELVIIPHKQLSLISFEMLDESADGQASKYLIHSRPVRYELSASLMRRKEDNQDNKAGHLLAGFAASDFEAGKEGTTSADVLSEGVRGKYLSPLPSANREVSEVTEITKGTPFLHATPDDFLKHAASYEIIHVAAHAVADQGPYHEANLLFETDKNGNNIVRDVEVSALNLQAKLAVLSACNTGIGQLHNSEGLINLGRSFFIAGCPAVVMSLWTVSDRSTATIMADFYRNLKKGETKSVALQHAKLNYLKNEDDPLRHHPYYWAGFVVVGDDAPIPFNSGFSTTLIIAAIVVLLIVGAIIYFRRSRSSAA